MQGEITVLDESANNAVISWIAKMVKIIQGGSDLLTGNEMTE